MLYNKYTRLLGPRIFLTKMHLLNAVNLLFRFRYVVKSVDSAKGTGFEKIWVKFFNFSYL